MEQCLIPMACNGCILVSRPGRKSDEILSSLTCSPGGGLPTSTNRTKWPVSGGAVGVQPGWFAGHSTALMYINLGLGTEPLNMSHVMIPVFQINGPTNEEYGGEFCFPQVPLPANISVNIGDNATIQVVEAAKHGAALYSVSEDNREWFQEGVELTCAVCRHNLRGPGRRCRGQRDQLP